MRRLVFTLFMLICSFSASAESLLDTFEKSLTALGAYKVCFTVNLDNSYTLAGEYVVEGANFYVRLGNTELYVTDGVKYDVANDRREVVVDSAQSLGGDILSNPASAFARLKEQYNVSQSVVDGRATARLESKDGAQSAVVVADSSGKLPESIVYSQSESFVKITFTSIAASSESVPRFDRSKYAQYELVDMR